MNHNIRQVSLCCLTAAGMMVGFPSCDNVDEHDRLIDYPLPTAEKTMLVMEFTGMRCVNCPEGAHELHGLLEAYPENVVVCGLHPKNVIYTNPIKGLDLTSEVATDYYDHYRPGAFPYAIFDGMPDKDSNNYNRWSSIGIETLENAVTVAALDLETAGDAASVSARGRVMALADWPGAVNVSVWITESDITGGQLTSSGTLMDYKHNHVVRASLNGSWGQPLAGSLSAGKTYDVAETSIVPSAAWNLSNCEIVMFVSDAHSHKVLQVVSAPLGESKSQIPVNTEN